MSTLPRVVADFETQLATAISIGGTSFTLATNVDDDGVALPDGLYCFTVDNGSSVKEYLMGSMTSGVVTSVQSVSRQAALTSGAMRPHRVGASVIVTDFVAIKYLADFVSGNAQLDHTNPLSYDGTASITSSNELATKAYVDGIAIAGAPDASTTVKGIVKMSVAPASPTAPIAVGDNDPRVPTASQAQFISAFTGMIAMHGGSVAPTGFLLCDGAAVSRSTYAALFAVIGTSFGAGDGSTTFNVPDLRSRTPIGKGAGTKVATVASATTSVLTVTGPTNAANNEFQTGQPAVFGATVAGNLVNATTYYLVRTGNLTFSVATTLANAQNGTVITLAGTERGTFTITLATRSLGDTGGEENHAMSSNELLAHIHSLPQGVSGTSTNPLNTSASGGTPINTGSAGGNAAMNVMSPFAAVTFVIKT